MLALLIATIVCLIISSVREYYSGKKAEELQVSNIKLAEKGLEMAHIGNDLLIANKAMRRVLKESIPEDKLEAMLREKIEEVQREHESRIKT